MMDTTLTMQSQSITRKATLRGCALLIHHIAPIAHCAGTRRESATCLLQLDRAPATYSRSLTLAELAALARLNPDDAPPPVLHRLLADLALTLELFRPDGWEGLRVFSAHTRKIIPNALLTPFARAELSTLGRVASEVVALGEEAANGEHDLGQL